MGIHLDHHIRVTNTSWMAEAKCKGQDVNRFFPASVEQTHQRQLSKRTQLLVDNVRKEFCLLCPVRLQCFDFAVATHAQGIHGGFLFRAYNKTATIKRERKKIIEEMRNGVAS